MSLGAMQTTADVEEGPDAVEDNFIEELFVPRSGAVKESELEWAYRGQALEQAQEKVAQEGVPREQWRVLRTKMLSELVDVIRRRLEGDPPVVDRTDVAEMESARAGPQDQATFVITGETQVAVAADGDIGAAGGGVQQPSGGVCQRRHGDDDGRLVSPGGGFIVP